MNIIDPYKIYCEMPLTVFTDNSNNFVSWVIKWRTAGIYNHVMNMKNSYSFLSQNPNGLKVVPLDKYLKRNIKLKFWEIICTKEQRNKMLSEMEKDSNLPWYKTMYDFLGIFGQAIGIRRLNNPMKMFCQERNAKYLRIIDKDFPRNLSPEGANEYMKTKPLFYKVYGYWMADV